MSLRVLIAGGGTGGHVFPAIALAEELKRAQPDSEVLFVGSEGGLEKELVPQAGFALSLLPVGKLKGSSAIVRLKTLVGLGPGLVRAASILRRFKPNIVVGVGGYASGPIVLASAAMWLPIILLEQNTIPGLTNRVLSRFARKVITCFPETAQHLPRGRALELGNPLRPRLIERLSDTSRKKGEGKCLLVLGGSQGARALNDVMLECSEELFQRVDDLTVLHQTGRSDQQKLAVHYQRFGGRAEAVAFIDDMADAYHRADLVLSRSGATTIAELGMVGLPAILVPYPYAADDHQAHNAAAMAAAGAAEVVRQEELDARFLIERVCGIFESSEREEGMKKSMKAFGRPLAGARIVDTLGSIVG
jgi:UDP-N-acetylglucosamine--N-acetylmuramyl-(pentapeptide) pyrophosphoryl-undecaprenol N-acetylglucosamine transferase